MSLDARSARYALSTQRQSSGLKQRRFVDGWLLLATGILMLMGLMSLYSIDKGSGTSKYFLNQSIRIVIGFVPFAFFYLVHPDWLKRNSWIFYSVTVVLLGLVLARGETKGGAERWIQLGPLEFQPSEMAKLLIVVTLASFFSLRMERIKSIGTFLISCAVIAVPLMLIFKQPHLGATITIMVAWIGVMVAGGVPSKFWIGAGVALLILLGGAVRFGMLSDYQQERVRTFLKGGSTQDERYQQERALIAFGSGGLTGKGYLKGEFKGTRFVPEQQTDYISTVIGEEGGLVGCSLMLGAFLFFFYRVWLIMFAARDPYHKMIAGGIFSYLAFHMIVNLGMNLELLPVVGLWLPFLSFGGTAMWLCMSSVGLLLNIRSREEAIAL